MPAGVMVAAVAALTFAAPIPAPKRVPGCPTLPEVRAAFGRKYTSREVRTLALHAGNPELSRTVWVLRDPKRDSGEDYFWLWKAKGLDASFEGEALAAVWFFNEGADEHKRYGGELPEGLTFADDLSAAKKKLGLPEDEDTVFERPSDADAKVADRIETWSTYPSKGITVTFRRPIAAKAGTDRIYHVCLQPPWKP